MQKEKEKRNPGYITWLNRLAVAATIAAIAEAVHIMKNGFGLLEQLDFGAGAYYYADIPGFASLVNGSHYQSPGPKRNPSVLDYCFRLSYNFRKICVKTLILDESSCCMEKRIFTVGKRF